MKTKMPIAAFNILFFSMLLFIGCKKKDNVVPPTTSSFTNLNAGSSWTYKYTEGNIPPVTYTLSATNKDTVVASGKTYKVLTSSFGGPNNYMAKVQNEYYRFASFPTLGINNFEELYLKDDQPVNGTWTGAISFIYLGATVNAILTYTIKGKGETRTVLGRSFSNVTHVRLDIVASGFPIGGSDFYYAEAIGMIENSFLINPPLSQPYISKEELVSYTLK